MTTTNNVKAWLVSGHGRETVYDKPQPWAVEDPEYTVEELGKIGAVVEPLPSDIEERFSIMEELFELQDKEIQVLQERLSQFVEAVEAIVEITEVVSHSNIENRAKIIVIGESCKELLKSRDENIPE